MVPEHEQSLPPFQILASTLGFLSEEEMDRLIADHVALLSQAKLGTGTTNADLRRSQIVFLKNEPRYRWLYERLWAAVQECNRRFFCVDIYGIEGNIQLARYDSSDQGFYDWHTDFADLAPLRKISVDSAFPARGLRRRGSGVVVQKSARQGRTHARIVACVSELRGASSDSRHTRRALEPRRLDRRNALALRLKWPAHTMKSRCR